MTDFRDRQKALYQEALEQPWWCEHHGCVHPGAPPVDRWHPGMTPYPDDEEVR